MVQKNNNVSVEDDESYIGIEFMCGVIDKLYLVEDKENILLELDEHVRDMTPEYLRKEKLFY